MIKAIREKATKKDLSLSLVLPAYNEEENIEWFTKDILKTAPSMGFNNDNLEIIIVDDGSTDRTGAIADKFSKQYKNVRVIHKKNNGYCGAILSGIKEAKQEYCAYMPADGQTRLEDIKPCLSYFEKADLILGDRGKREDYSLYRIILSHAYLLLLRLLFDTHYKDINWFHIWRTKKIQSLKTISEGLFILAEIAIRFREKNYVIVEASVPYRSRRFGKTKLAKLSVIWKTFTDLFKFWATDYRKSQ